MKTLNKCLLGIELRIDLYWDNKHITQVISYFQITYENEMGMCCLNPTLHSLVVTDSPTLCVLRCFSFCHPNALSITSYFLKPTQGPSYSFASRALAACEWNPFPD